MHRGYIKLWRKSKLSPVWQMPPLYGRIWSWLLMSVNYETKTIPTPTGPVTVHPGQRITSYRQIAEEVAWYEYGVLKTPNTKTIKTILEWLESNGQCTAESNAKGTVITVTNWDTYNGHDEEEVTQKEQQEVTESKRRADTNKKGKKEPKKKEELKPIDFQIPEWVPLDSWNAYLEKRKKMKKPIEPENYHLAIRKLEQLKESGNDPGEVLDQSILNNWQGLFEIKDKQNGSIHNRGATQVGRKAGFIEANGAGTDFLS